MSRLMLTSLKSNIKNQQHVSDYVQRRNTQC